MSQKAAGLQLGGGNSSQVQKSRHLIGSWKAEEGRQEYSPLEQRREFEFIADQTNQPHSANQDVSLLKQQHRR